MSNLIRLYSFNEQAIARKAIDFLAGFWVSGKKDCFSIQEGFRYTVCYDSALDLEKSLQFQTEYVKSSDWMRGVLGAWDRLRQG